MSNELLFGSKNQGKYLHISKVLEPLNLRLRNLQDFNIDVVVTEDGTTASDNAKKKSETYYSLVKLPTLSIDSGLHIEQFPASMQPGLMVKRINGAQREDVTDPEILEHYIEELKRIGGTSKGIWNNAFALTVGEGHTFVEEHQAEVILTAMPYRTRTEGTPLNAIQIDPSTGKYFSEMSAAERASTPDSAGLFEFVRKYAAYLTP